MPRNVCSLAIAVCLGGWANLISTGPVLLTPVSAAAERGTATAWTELPSLPDARGLGGPFAGASGEVLLVAGGTDFDKPPWEQGRKSWYDSIYAMLPGDSAWRTAGRLPGARAYGASVETDRGLVCAGGADAQAHYADVHLLRWQSGEVKVDKLPPLPVPSAYLCGARLGSVVYLAGGAANLLPTSTLRRFWAMDLADVEPRWRELEPWPGPGRILAVAGVQAGAFYLFGGADMEVDADGTASRRYLSDAYRFVPGQGWQTIAALPHPVAAAPSPAPAVGQSHLLVLGGDDGTRVDVAPAVEHPGFLRTILAYHTITDTWIELDRTPAPHVTTATARWQGQWVVPSGESRPGVRSPEVWSFQPQPRRTDFGLLNYIALTAYLVGVVGIGVYCSRFNRTTDDFFRGGQSIPWWAAGLSIFATVLSSITYMAVPGLGYGTNWNLFVQNSYIIILPLAALVYLPFYRRLNLTSAYEYLEQRFNVGTRLVASLLFICFQ